MDELFHSNVYNPFTIHIPIHPYEYPFVQPYEYYCPHIYPFIHMNTYLSNYMSTIVLTYTHSSIHIPICPHMYPFVHVYYLIIFLSLISMSQIGRLQESYKTIKCSLEAYPDHIESQELLRQLQQHFAAL